MNIDFAGLARLDADVRVISSGRSRWRNGSVTRFEGTGRTCDLLYLILSGKRLYKTGGKPDFDLCPGEIVFIPRGACYTSVVTEGDISNGIFIDFEMKVSGEPVFVSDAFRHFKADSVQKEHLLRIADSGGLKLSAKAELLSLLADISVKAETAKYAGGRFASIREAVLEIERHPEEPVDVPALARRSCMSESGFRTLFRQYTGGPAPVAYRNRLRADRADELIRRGGMSIAEISDTLGFYDTAHFYRVYKKLRGHPPLRAETESR